MNKTVEEISSYIKVLLNSNLSPSFLYHNLQHTKDVVDTASNIADHYLLPEGEKELILISAWFHDTGYINSIINHEEHSANIAGNYLKNINFPEEKTETIKKLILSTRSPRQPQNLFEEILSDADIAYIGSENLVDKISLLRKEWESTINKFYSDYEWLKQNIEFIEANPFLTDYAKKEFDNNRSINIKKLTRLAEEISKNHF